MKTLIPFLFLFIAFASCERNEIPEEFSPEISFEVSQFIETQFPVLNFELTPSGFYYSGYEEPRIYFSTFSGDTMSIKTESEVKSLVYDRRFRKLYIGTKSSGLGVLKGNTITYFSPDNSILPRYVIVRMDVDSDGNLWIASSNDGAGGLYRFNGNEFIHFSTENSPLHHDLIRGICCRNSAIYIVTGGTEATHKVFKIEEESGNNYTWEEIISEGYFYDIKVDLNENVYLLFGHFASGIMILFKNGETKTITPEPDGVEYIYTQFTPDKRSYMWMCKFPRLGEGGNLSVFNDEKWHEPETDLAFGPPNWIDVDDNNNIWMATNSGICILNQ